MAEATRPIPFKTQRRKLKYKLAAAAFIHDGKSLSECAKEFGIMLQPLCYAAKEDEWQAFQGKLLSGEIGGQGAPGFLAKVAACADSGLVGAEMTLSLNVVPILQKRREELVEILKTAPLENVPGLTDAISKLRKEIEEILLIKEAKRALPRLLGDRQGSRPTEGDVVDW